jgi:hypothetical protein
VIRLVPASKSAAFQQQSATLFKAESSQLPSGQQAFDLIR